MKELSIEEMTALKGGFTETNVAIVASAFNVGEASATAANVSDTSAFVDQDASASAAAIVGNVHARIRQSA